MRPSLLDVEQFGRRSGIRRHDTAQRARANRIPSAAVGLRRRELRSQAAIRSRQHERVHRKVPRLSMRHQLESLGQERLQVRRLLRLRDVGWRVRDDVEAIHTDP